VASQFGFDVKVLAYDIQDLLAFKKGSSRTKIMSHCATIFKNAVFWTKMEKRKNKYFKMSFWKFGYHFLLGTCVKHESDHMPSQKLVKVHCNRSII
jgi:hypothetical protein